MTTKILAIAAGLGTWIFLDVTWWLGLIIAAGTYYFLQPQDQGTKAVQTIDFATGEVKLQPMNRAAQKYLDTLD